MGELTISTIKEIVSDLSQSADGLLKVGLTGSFARNEQTPASDVDLVFVMAADKTDDILSTMGVRLRSIFLEQFSVNLDVINYNSMLKRLSAPQAVSDMQLNGYKQMLNDLVWIWDGEK